ncbi:MAG: hypothetical protein IPG92_15610 [Flavobacteriales bacterium]|nr:hypothetical protein [Flavobacteriales bacterium]
MEFQVLDNAFQDNENLQWFISLSGYERNNGYIAGKTTAIAHPPLTCNDLQRALNSSGTASLLPADLHGSVHASCGAVLASASQTSFSCADIGVVPVTLTLAFPDGSTNTCVRR